MTSCYQAILTLSASTSVYMHSCTSSFLRQKVLSARIFKKYDRFWRHTIALGPSSRALQIYTQFLCTCCTKRKSLSPSLYLPFQKHSESMRVPQPLVPHHVYRPLQHHLCNRPPFNPTRRNCTYPTRIHHGSLPSIIDKNCDSHQTLCSHCFNRCLKRIGREWC